MLWTRHVLSAGGLVFDGEDPLVTEGGIVLIDPDSNFGDRLSVVRYQTDL